MINIIPKPYKLIDNNKIIKVKGFNINCPSNLIKGIEIFQNEFKDYLNGKNINEIVSYFKKFLDSNDDSISLYQTLIGSKLILTLLKKSNHIKDIPEIIFKLLK